MGVTYYNADNIDRIHETIGNIKGDLVVQKALQQCEELNRLNSSSVNTIRILTLMRKEKVTVYSSVLRMGINDAKVDNASSGGITCGINADGSLKDVAYSAKGIKYYEHPTTKVRFNTIKVPSFEKAIELVKSIHPRITHFRLVSWDMAIDQNKAPVLIEANLCYGELDFHQLNNGPLFGGDTEEILEEVFGAELK